MFLKAELIIFILGFVFTLPMFTSSSRPSASLDDTENENISEYCSAEVFSAKCLKNEVIVMTEANYGRMKIGRCLQRESEELRAAFSKNPLYLGCFVNVLSLLDEKCSGRNQCDFHVPDAELRKEEPCIQGLTLFLEARFQCVTVIEEDRSCIVSVSSNPLHMMRSPPSSTLNCGTKTQPWMLEAPAGQQIEVNLIEFSSKQRHSVHDSQSQVSNTCGSRGQIIDKFVRNNVSICRIGQERKKAVYKSLSNSIQVILEADNKMDRLQEYGTFLIRFAAVGCLNLVPPEDAWLRRDGNEAVVGCYTSRQSWTLRCSRNQWVGVIGNCTVNGIEIHSVSKVTPLPEDNQAIVIVTIVVIGLTVCLVILCCGAVCFRRYSNKIKKYQRSNEETETWKHHQREMENGRENNQCTLIPVG